MKELAVGSRCTNRPLEALAAQPRSYVNNFLPVGQQILRVLRQPIADGGRFRGLQVREGHRRRVGIAFDLRGEGEQQRIETRQHQIERIAHPHGIGIILDVHRCRAEVDDATADGALLRVRAHFGHQVMVDFGLDLLRARQVDLFGMGAKIGHLFHGHQPRRFLRLGQRHPDASPQPPFVRLAPQSAHLRRAIAPGEGREIGVIVEKKVTGNFQSPTSSSTRTSPITARDTVLAF